MTTLAIASLALLLLDGQGGIRQIDAGTFQISIQGKPAGEESFEIAEAGQGFEIRTKTMIHVGSLDLSNKGILKTDLSWRPVEGDFETVAAGQTTKLALRRSGDTLELTTAASGQPPTTTRQSKPVDLFVGNNMLAHLAPLCSVARKEETFLTAFPGVPLRLAPASRQKFSRMRLGMPSEVELTLVSADLAQSVRIELACEGTKLVALRQPLASVSATRVGYEEFAQALERKERKKPPTPEDLTELPRKVNVQPYEGVSGATLACTLLVPQAYAEVPERTQNRKNPTLPAVVFITGSGPQDRDEDTVGPGGLKLSIFKVLAIRIAEAGIASLRCDDRGTGESTGEFKKGTLETFVGDTQATLRTLRSERTIDPDRIGLIGHSEGGIIAPLVASKDPKLQSLVLMAGTGRPLDAILLEQQETLFRQTGASQEEIQKRLARSKEVFRAIREGKPLPPSTSEEERRAIAASGQWLRSHFLHDPAATARKLGSIPVLIAQGARDIQVSLRDAELLRDSFLAAGNKQVTYKIYPNLNHLFAVAKTGGLADYSDPDASVDASFLQDVTEFLTSTLKR